MKREVLSRRPELAAKSLGPGQQLGLGGAAGSLGRQASRQSGLGRAARRLEIDVGESLVASGGSGGGLGVGGLDLRLLRWKAGLN
jgi:hypothetical protein